MLELVFADRDGSLLAATWKAVEPNVFDVHPIRGPKTKGVLTAVRLSSSDVLVAREIGGSLLSVERTTADWSEAQRLPSPGSGQFGDPSVATFNGRVVTTFARGPGSSFWTNNLSSSHWGHWADTKVPAVGSDTPVIAVGGRFAMTDKRMLESLAASLTHLQLLGFFISIDQTSPTPTFEGDQVTINYTLLNGSPDVGTGSVTASWDGKPLDAVPPPFAPPLQPGQQFQGMFSMGQFLHAQAGIHHIRLRYEASTVTKVIDDPALGIGPITIKDITQFAEDDETVNVLAFSDSFPTDDPPIQPGPYACLPTTLDQQHACGQATCAGGNTPQTCPQDCPVRVPDIRSYNSQDLCRGVASVVEPKTIADVQTAIHAAAQAGQRVRVLGKEHTSNAQICTDGAVVSMASLKGAAPVLGQQGDFCSRFDCTAALDSGQPMIETFEGVQTVRVGPGKNLFELEDFLDQQGLSLGFGIPGFREPTVGGAIATGTHGSSPMHPAVISTRVRSITMVMADGSIREFSSQTTLPDTLWKAVRANLGFLGVVVQVRLALEAAFNLHAKTRWMSAKDLLAGGAPHSLVAGCDFGEMVWFPHQGSDDAPVMVICETKTTQTGEGEIRLLYPEDSDDPSRALPAVDLIQQDACAGQSACEMESFRAEVLRIYQPAFASSDCSEGLVKVALDAPLELVATYLKILLTSLTSFGAIFAECCTKDCNVDKTGRWHRMMSSPLTPAQFRPFERDWEIFIPGNNAAAAIQTAKSYFQQNGICLPLIGVFLRFAPAEDGTLVAHTVNQGPFATGPAGMFFEMVVLLPKGMTCGDQARYEKVYSDLAEKLVSPPINGRGHWAKNRRSLFQLQRRLGTYGDNMNSFREVVKQFDPNGMFANQFGVDMGLRWPRMSKPVPPDTDTAGCTPNPPPVVVPSCGAANRPCCTNRAACDAGLVCNKNGFCVSKPVNVCGQCAQDRSQCKTDCAGDSFCDCSCENQFCSCQLAHCANHCQLRTCKL